MIIPGLVSVTFRNLSPSDIVDLVARAGLKAIEWGGDVHVPHGDLAVAGKVRELTLQAGLAVAAYGSYFRAGEPDSPAFSDVLSSACELQAPVIRVWAGKKGSADCDEEYRQAVVYECRHAAQQAGEKGIKVACEYHGNTLTDTAGSARQLLEEVDHPNFLSYWQPAVGLSVDQRLESLDAVIDHLSNIHVFQWRHKDRLHLDEGSDEWAVYLNRIRKLSRDRYALLEFVQNDNTESFLRDARTLLSWVEDDA